MVQYLVSTKIQKAIYAVFNTESGKTDIMFSLFSNSRRVQQSERSRSLAKICVVGIGNFGEQNGGLLIF